jgi:hypothetical protein
LSRRRGKVWSDFDDSLPLRPLAKLRKKATACSFNSSFEIRENRINNAVKSKPWPWWEGAE